MKSISLLLSLFLATNVFAQEIVKSCKTKLSFPGTEEIYNTNLTVIKKGNSLAVKTWQQSDRGGPIKEFDEVATVAEFQIRNTQKPLSFTNEKQYFKSTLSCCSLLPVFLFLMPFSSKIAPI